MSSLPLHIHIGMPLKLGFMCAAGLHPRLLKDATDVSAAVQAIKLNKFGAKSDSHTTVSSSEPESFPALFQKYILENNLHEKTSDALWEEFEGLLRTSVELRRAPVEVGSSVSLAEAWIKREGRAAMEKRVSIYY